MNTKNKNKNISKKDLGKILADKLNKRGMSVSIQNSVDMVTEVFDTIIDLLSNSKIEQISITKFGIFKKKFRKSRSILVAKNNPIVKKGVKLKDLPSDQLRRVNIPGKNILVFKSSKVVNL